ncbi:RNA polymerase sigma factor [Paractinoplanes lichenicola]|uniref:RNA polymerase sigma factor n=1 Tax=Paractinoplanes lichenicola TaxID=2802976 RepID=UPI0027DC8FC6|nr:DUF6596 domain-containing protein [Actinoplanes lichenicola]
MNDALLRELVPAVIGIVVRRGADFAAAEDAVQEALIRALETWPDDPPRDPQGWLVAAAWRKFLDSVRSESARQRRELAVEAEPVPGPAESTDDSLWLYFLCAHPSLSPGTAVALTLRAVGGLTTRQIAAAYLVPEATMAQRITRAKRQLAGQPLDRPGELGTVLRVLYLVFNEGYGGDVDPGSVSRLGRGCGRAQIPPGGVPGKPGSNPGSQASPGHHQTKSGPGLAPTPATKQTLSAEAIRLTRQLAAATDAPEVAGLLALMLLHHARRASRTGPGGRLVPLAEQDRSRWDTTLIAEGVDILQAALARDRLGEYQAQAAIAALHADAPSAAETDWVQIVEWYDELLELTASPVVRLNRAVAIGEADGPQAGLAELDKVDPAVPRYLAVRAYLLERAGDRERAADLYAEAAYAATNMPERDHLTRAAARLRGATT